MFKIVCTKKIDGLDDKETTNQVIDSLLISHSLNVSPSKEIIQHLDRNPA